MQCPRCQHENRPQAKFCEECASPLARTCPNCSAQASPTAKFCSECAQPLASSAASHSRFPGPDAYTPRHLAEKILTSKAALEGERKQVTVLFADLKGSMELLADRDPEEARKLLDPVLERMMEAVHRYEGTVNQVLGDGIMALFGAPVAHEDHAVRACYAALRMQRRVNLYADEMQQHGGTPVQIRVGINSGEVVVRAIGSDLHMDYSAIGQTTHLAARMEQMAKPGSALITDATLNLAEGYIQVRPLGAVPVKGLEAPTPVYELTGTVPNRSRLQASAARGLTRFVGRDSELQQLSQALERAAARHGQAVAVVGEPGVGKSRLVWEFTRSHRTQGWLVLEGGSVSYGKATPHLPVIELMKAYSRIQERDEPRDIRERVAGKLLMLDRALEPLLTPLLALLDVPVDDAAWTALDPPQRRQRILDAVKGLLLRESQIQPLLLVFEDLHWIDAETQTFLDGLMESLPTARILLLVNYRPEYQHAWGGKSYYVQLRIDPLPPERADTLVTALLGEDPTLAPLKRMLIARTEGNPFFLEESVRSLVETQVLVGERGAYRVTKAPETWQIPVTAQAILAARIDRLAPEDKPLLQAASVIGKDVPFALLQAIVEGPEETLRRGLANLQAAEFLYELRLFPDLKYTFKHALTHEVAYQSLLQDQRRRLHKRVVEAFEALHPNRLVEHSDWLARHVVRGEVWEKTPKYLRPATAEQGLKANTFWWRGEHARAVEENLKDLSAAHDFKHFAAQVNATFGLGQAYHSLGDYPTAIQHLRRNVASLADDMARERFDLPGLASVLSRAWLVWCLAERGDFAEAGLLATEARTLAEFDGDAYSRVIADLARGGLQLVQGHVAAALPSLVQSLLLVEEHGIQALLPVGGALLGRGHLETGLVADALPVLERAVEQANAAGFLANQPLRLAWLGEAHLLIGQASRADDLARQAFELARAQGERGHEAHAGRLLGTIARDRAEPDAAEAAYQGALALAEELGMRPLVAHCHLGLGRLYRRTGGRAKADEHVTVASAMYREMGMNFWLAQAETGLTEAG